MTVPVTDAIPLNPQQMRAALSRIEGSVSFQRAPTLAAFLRYVVERVLAGEASRIKGYTIAVEALGRAPSFDPLVDPIVRVEAARLRRRLHRYYEGPGRDDPVIIELPLGSYVPAFRARATASGGGQDLGASLQQFISLCRLQLRAMAAEIEIAERMLAQMHRHAGASAGGVACRMGARLLPTAPSPKSDASMADGRQGREDKQAQGAPAARAGRPRPGRDRGDAAHDRADPRGL